MSFDYKIPALQADPKVHPEEIRRATIADSTSSRAGYYLIDLEDLIGKDLRQADTLQALIITGLKIMELGLHTKGRLKSADGRSDAFLEATAANVKTAFRNAVAIMDECDLDLGAWGDALEIAKPAVEDLTRISKAMDRPGVKTAVTPVVPEKPKADPGPRLIAEDGEPAPGVAIPTPSPTAAAVNTIGFNLRDADIIDAEVVEESPLDDATEKE